MKIFLAANSLLPHYGGPAYSVARLAGALVQAGGEVGLWARDQSAPATPFLPPHTEVQRLSGSAVEALARFGRPDVLHDNGLWLPHNHRLAMLAGGRRLPRLVSTRGMLEPWAMRHKRLKKTLAWWLYQRRDLQRAQLLHATAAQEASHLERLGLGVPICVIANGVDLPDDAPTPPQQGGQRTALFLGRVYPVKGLPMLIEAWGQVRPAGWRLTIAGPDEAGPRAEVERAVARAGLGEVVSFIGAVEGEAKRAAFAGADLLVLPSHSESFGIVVAEALAHGVPALTTTGTPWKELAARECGWSVSPTVAGLAQGLRQATAPDAVTLREMGAKGRAWVASEFAWPAVAKRFLTAYQQILESKRP